MSENVYISMTTIPSRIPKLNITLDSLLSQNFKPKKIIINIPKISRITQLPYDIPQFIKNNPNILINIVEEDMGPILKLLPSLNIVGPNDLIITVDDDIIYPNNLVEILVKYYHLYSSIICLSGIHIKLMDNDIKLHRDHRNMANVKISEAFAGVIYARSYFKDDFIDYVKGLISNIKCLKSDDLIISNYLYNINKIVINNKELNVKKIKYNSDPIYSLNSEGTKIRYKKVIRYLISQKKYLLD